MARYLDLAASADFAQAWMRKREMTRGFASDFCGKRPNNLHTSHARLVLLPLRRARIIDLHTLKSPTLRGSCTGLPRFPTSISSQEKYFMCFFSPKGDVQNNKKIEVPENPVILWDT